MSNDQPDLKKPNYLRLVFTIFLVALPIIVGTFFFAYHTKVQKQIEDLNDEISVLKTEKDSLTKECEAMKLRVENIKTLDDLLERDIKLYIKAKYRKVPKSVAHEIAVNIIKFGKQYDVSPFILVGIVQVESGFNPMITGPNTKHGNARGLMQVMPEWVPKFGLKDIYELYDIDTNIESGCKVFNAHKSEEKGSISQALYKYVNGDKKYVEDVFTAMGRFVAFRSTVDEGKDAEVQEEEKEKDESSDIQNKNLNTPVKEDKKVH